jgi:hypothetical protein
MIFLERLRFSSSRIVRSAVFYFDLGIREVPQSLRPASVGI